MILFEILYGKTCTTLVIWDSPVDHLMLGTEMLQHMEQIIWKVQKNPKVAQDLQKSYSDLKRQHKKFYVGDHIYQRVKTKKSSLKFGSCTKLAPQFCVTFQILERIGPMAYKLALSTHLRIHNVFHI